MMTNVVHLLIAYATSFVINMIPAGMPATWQVLAFFYIRYKPPLLLLTVGGAVFSGLGRVVLALITRRWGRKIVPAKQLANLDALSSWLEERPAWQLPFVVFVGSLGPIPSNQMFIALGLTSIDLRPVTAGFFAGRAISYTLSVAATSKVAGSLESIQRHSLTNASGWVIQLISFGSIILFTMIPWAKILHISKTRVTP